MLQTIRNSSKRWAWIVVALISLPFALWGVERFQTNDTHEIITTVGERDITRAIYSQSYFTQKRRLQDDLGDEYETRVDDAKLQQQVFQRLILSALVESYAKESGFAISDKMLADSIRSQSALLDASGNFDVEKYKLFLNLNGFTPAVYEEQLRWQGLSNQLTDAYVRSNFITDGEVESFKELSSHEREVAWVTLPWSQVANEITVSEEEIASFYEKNQQAFSVPEEIKIEYIALEVDDLIDSIQASDEDVENFYDENKNQFLKEERRHIRHILFNLGDLDGAQNVLAEIKNGADFEALAREYSIDTVSSKDGGDLGTFSRGVMVAPFEESAFSLDEGEISGLVETQFGYHIIKVVDIEESKIEPLVIIFDEVKRAYQRDEALARFFELQDTLATTGYENPTALSVASEATGLTVDTSEWFSSNSGTGIAKNKNIRESAFSKNVKIDGNNSDIIEITPEHVAMIRKKEVAAAYVKPLAEVEESIRTSLLREKSTNLLLERTQQDIKSLTEKNVTWEEVLAKYEISTGSVTFTWKDGNPAGNELEDKVTELLFNMLRSYSASQIQYNVAESSLGDVLILANRNSRSPLESSDSTEEVVELLFNFQQQNEQVSIFQFLQEKYDINNIDTSRL